MTAEKKFNLKVDHEICQGTGYCARVAPDLFVIAGPMEAKVLIAEPTEDFESQILEAATLCPTRAITY
ncbi:MAG: ferredoxin [Acidimicrobiaceae bacterium]|jgi:ferredoxin|nr:ferredoxin [Acidimicrobiaceae bacterium]|tara:strand:+ start:89631 stop:89834 length:204 start_codon:yes stop_codon:yes gene_type:complete